MFRNSMPDDVDYWEVFDMEEATKRPVRVLRAPPSWLVAYARGVCAGGGSYDQVREAAMNGGATPFMAMVAWQMAQGHDLDSATAIAAAIARRKGMPRRATASGR